MTEPNWDHPQFQRMLDDPARARAELSLYEFAKQAWPHVEQGRPLVDGYCLQAVCEHLQAVTQGQITRLVINIPPGCSKSMTTNVLWPTWEWGPASLPAHRYISASVEQGLATRDLVRGRELLLSDWYQDRWPISMTDDQDEKTHYQNTKGGWRKSVGVRGTLIGYRGDRIIIDDPHDPLTAESELRRNEVIRWGTETVPTRLNNDDESAIVLVMQRLHEQDLSAVYLESGDWVHLMLPMEFEAARKCSTVVEWNPDGEGWRPFEDWRTEDTELLWPELKSRDAVDRLKRTLSSQGGNYAVDSQLQQRPTSRGGTLFKRDDFQIWDGPSTPKVSKRVRGWDLAASKSSRSAFTAGVRMALLPDGRVIVEDMVAERLGPLDVETLIAQCADADGTDCKTSIPQDPGAAGVAWKAHMAGKLHGHDVRFSTETGDKDYRARPFAAQVEAGMVYLMPGSWNALFLSEVASFGPGASRKDVVDACSRAYAALVQRNEATISIEPATLFTTPG